MSRLIRKVDVPVRDIPNNIIKDIQAKVINNEIKGGTTVKLADYTNTTGFDQLSPGIQALLKDGTIQIPSTGQVNDATILVRDKATGIKVGQVKELLEGDPFTGKFPDIKLFYRRLGVADDFLNNKAFNDLIKLNEQQFKQTKGFMEGYKKRLSEEFGATLQNKYGVGPDGLQKFANDYPDKFEKYLLELEKTPYYKAKLFADEKAKNLWESIKKNPKRTALLALIAILSPVVYTIIDEKRKDENGCRLYSTESGFLEKVELLTCDDDLLKVNNVTLRKTCATQNYPTETPVACPANQFNPCLTDSTNRANSDSFPLVPDVCSKYLYRKTPGAKDQSTEVTRIDACASSKDGCSQEYCNAAKFAGILPEGYELKCNNQNWWQSFVKTTFDFGEDALCTLIPLCNAGNGAGNNLDWLKWVALAVGILIVIAVIVRVFFWKSKGSEETASANALIDRLKQLKEK